MPDDHELDPFLWDGGGDDLPAAEAPDPPRRTRGRLLAACGVAGVLGGVIALVVVVVVGGTPAQVSGAPLALAADVTSRAQGFRYTFDMKIGVAGRSVDVGANGAINEGAHPSGSMSLRAGGVTVNELFVPPWLYVQVPGAINRWDRINFDTYRATLGADSSSLGGDPTRMLDYLRSVGSVSLVGGEEIDGVPTSHYHAVVDLGSVAAAVPASERAGASRAAALLERATGNTTMPIDVWLDTRSRVRRFAMALSISTRAGSASESVTMDIVSFGPQPSAQPPPAQDVTDVTGQSIAALSQNLQQLGS